MVMLMKKMVITFMMVLLIVLAVACSTSSPDQTDQVPAGQAPVQAQVQPAPSPIPPPTPVNPPPTTYNPLPPQPPAVPIESAIAAQQPRSPSQPQPTEGIARIQQGEPQDYLTIEHIDLRRTSNDKGIFNRLNFTLRNVGSFEIRPVVTILFDKGIMGQGSPTVIEQEIELPPLKPGYKINKYVPTSIRFHELNRKKTLIVSVRAKFADQQTDLDVVKQEFYPIDTLKDAEISWT